MREEFRERIAAKIKHEAKKIQPFLDDGSVVEIMLNEDKIIRIVRLEYGKIKTGVTFDRDEAMLLIGSIARYNDTSVNEQAPLLKASMPDGQRVQAIIEPVVSAPIFSIRCNRASSFRLDDYLVTGRMTNEMAKILRAALQGRKNILVSGGTGSGKTTLTTALLQELSAVAPDDRVVVMEDTSEISLALDDVIYLKTTEVASMCKLLEASLRLFPTRIIVGEIRGKEALDLLKAWNTGHPGGVCTLHANSAQSALSRFESLILEAQNLSIPFIRSLVSDAVDLIVHIQRDKKRGPIVSQIVGVNGMTIDGQYRLEELASYPAR